jgi:hypothetical protein
MWFDFRRGSSLRRLIETAVIGMGDQETTLHISGRRRRVIAGILVSLEPSPTSHSINASTTANAENEEFSNGCTSSIRARVMSRNDEYKGNDLPWYHHPSSLDYSRRL